MYQKDYVKNQQEYLDKMKQRQFYEDQRPLSELLDKFIMPDKQGYKYMERFKAAQQMKYETSKQIFRV